MNNDERVYVCYVLDPYAGLKNELTISCLTVTKSQAVIDKWLKSQLEEAADNGFMPEENPEEMIGECEYTLTLGKGNDKDGYESYFLVCRPEIIE